MKTLFTLGTIIAMATACHKSATQLDSLPETQPAVATAAQAPTAAQAEAPISNPSGANLANGALCTRLCAISAPLKCKAATECEQHCQQMLSLPACSSEMVRTLTCFANQPRENWECDDDGLPSIKEGHCNAEQAKFATCLQARQKS